jgi:hypothetical protein
MVSLLTGNLQTGENHVLFLMNVIMFIIRVLKLLSMQEKNIVLALVFIFVCAVPAGASTSKIASGAPVFIGESNLDISNALEGCHTIGWWQNGTITSAPPEKTITLYQQNIISEIIYHYNISPVMYANYSGPWYCVEKKPEKVVFEVLEPQLDIRVWDLDHNRDVSGTTVPLSANITYRVDTNLYHALRPLNRPDVNPSDSFFTVSLTDSYGQSISNIFTGSAGNSQTQILPFDNKPFITGSPFYWKYGKDWNRSARNAYGEPLYTLGTYTFTINQNLNHMEESFKSSGITDLAGKITQTNTVTFVKGNASVVIPETVKPVITTISVIPSLSSTTQSITTLPASSPLGEKTTYTSLPEWITLVGIVAAGVFIIWKRA